MLTTTVDKRGERVRQMFGQIAPCYDFLNHLLSLNVDRSWRASTVKLAPPTAGGPILDLCTGTGDLALAYDRAAGSTVLIAAADFCPEMLDRARQKAARSGAADRIAFIEADAQALPFPADHFELVTVAFGLRNVADTDCGLAEMVRVARPGGRVAILEFSKPRHPVLGRLYLAYFRHVLPRVGQFLSRSRENAYRYLPASVLEFPDGEALAARLRGHGLTNIRLHPFTCGIVTLYVGEKPAAA